MSVFIKILFKITLTITREERESKTFLACRAAKAETSLSLFIDSTCCLAVKCYYTLYLKYTWIFLGVESNPEIISL